jgi:hypothetical protein
VFFDEADVPARGQALGDDFEILFRVSWRRRRSRAAGLGAAAIRDGRSWPVGPVIMVAKMRTWPDVARRHGCPAC